MLNDKLINHYKSFQRERLFLDATLEKDGYISVVYSSSLIQADFNECMRVARFIVKCIKDYPKNGFIYVGPWHFKFSELKESVK